MKGRMAFAVALLGASAVCFATADGSWLKKVPQADRDRVNPYAGQPDAAAAGQNLFRNNCAKCHGADAQGKGSRPSLKSERLAAATDGEIAWIIKNGQTYKGMPSWGGLPEQMRWQLVTYIRSLNASAGSVNAAATKQHASGGQK
jgi:mono/diheme cytochrome c family protein